jgi:hypothetical protein
LGEVVNISLDKADHGKLFIGTFLFIQIKEMSCVMLSEISGKATGTKEKQ